MNIKMRLILIIVLIILVVQCKPKELIEYRLPEDLNEYDKKNVIADLETGKILYKDYCSRCHGIFGKAQPEAPDFSKVELKNNLEKRMRRAFTKDPISHEVTIKMMPEEVNTVLGFIQRYKRQPAP